MKPFSYTRARTLADAAHGTTEHQAITIAGGTNLLDLMKLQVETHRISPKRLFRTCPIYLESRPCCG